MSFEFRQSTVPRYYHTVVFRQSGFSSFRVRNHASDFGDDEKAFYILFVITISRSSNRRQI